MSVPPPHIAKPNVQLRTNPKYLPIARVAIPIKARADRFQGNAKVGGNFLLHHVECFGTCGIFRDEMRALMPADPFDAAQFRLGLTLAHLLDQLVVERPVVLLAEELGNDNDIVVRLRTPVTGTIGPNDQSHVGTHKCGSRVKALCVSTTPALLGGLLTAAVRIHARIVIQRPQVRIGFGRGRR